MKLFKKILLYSFALLYTPICLIRVVVACIISIDARCDKIINEYLSRVEKEIEEEELIKQ